MRRFANVRCRNSGPTAGVRRSLPLRTRARLWQRPARSPNRRPCLPWPASPSRRSRLPARIATTKRARVSKGAEILQTFEPVAVAVLTGFLGSGKTTLLNRLLKAPGMDSTAVIVNEFGEVGIDHLLVEQASDGVIELSDGCLCCTVRGELVDTLADLIDRMQTGRIAPLKRIIVETTGLADPVPVLQSILGHPALAAALRLSGVIATVDALNGEAALAQHEEAVRQVAVADRIVLTKSDIKPASGQLLARLRALNPRAPVVPAAEIAALELVEAGLRDPATGAARLAQWLGEGAHDHDHDHDGHDHHHHHHHHHDDRITSFSLVHDGPLSFSTIEMFLDLLRSTHGDRLLRMKGVVELAEDPRASARDPRGRPLHPSTGAPACLARGAARGAAGADRHGSRPRSRGAAFLGLHRKALDRYARPDGARGQPACGSRLHGPLGSSFSACVKARAWRHSRPVSVKGNMRSERGRGSSGSSACSPSSFLAPG